MNRTDVSFGAEWIIASGMRRSGALEGIVTECITKTERRGSRACLLLAATLFLGACASGPPDVPYPAFIQADDLPDAFLAGLPGARAKQFGGDARSVRSSNRLLLPANWDFGTGAAPDKSVEIFVLAGEVELAGVTLRPGGYAYIPSGSMGASLRTQSGADMLYFLSDADERAVIQMPLITGIESGRWQPLSDDPGDFGLSVMELRSDPGSGARTWLLKIDPVAVQAWQTYSTEVEGYLVSGNYQHSECVAGESATDTYRPGGYFLRPAAAINAGPEARSLETSIWFLRSLSEGERQNVDGCSNPE